MVAIKFVTMETQSVEMDDLLTDHLSRTDGSVQILSIRKSPFASNEPLATYLMSHQVNELNNRALATSIS